MDEHDAMRAQQQQQEAMDADVALQEMKQATQRLDEILQHMCAASSSRPDVAGIDSEDARFADALEHASDHDTSTSVPVIDSEEGAQQQRAEYASVQEYFSVRALLCVSLHTWCKRLTIYGDTAGN